MILDHGEAFAKWLAHQAKDQKWIQKRLRAGGGDSVRGENQQVVPAQSGMWGNREGALGHHF